MIITVDNLLPGRQYGIQLRARTSEGVSDWSKTFVVTVVTDTIPPKTPTGLTVVANGTTFSIAWNAVTQNADNTPLTDFSYYEVNITNQSSGSVTYTTSATKYDFSFEKNNAAFGGAAGIVNVKVRAVDKFGNASPYTAVVQGNNAPPSPPTNVTVSPLVDALSVSWTKATDPDIVEYQIYTGTSSTFTPSGAPVWRGNASNAVVKYVDYSNATWVKVCSVDVFGTQSTFATSTGSATPISSQNGSLGQRVYYATVAPTNQPNNPGDTWFVRELVGGTIVAQYEGAGGTSWNQRTLNSQVIANLDVGKLTSGTLNVAMAITAGDVNGVRTQMTGTGLKAYSLIAPPFAISATGYNFSGASLTPSTSYRYAVTSVTASGETTPTYLTKSTGPSDNSFFVGWTSVIGASSYNVYRQANPTTGTWALVYSSPDSTNLSFIDLGSAGTTVSPPSTNTAGFTLSMSTENGSLYMSATLDGVHRTATSGPRIELRSVPSTGLELAKTSLLGYTGYSGENQPGDVSIFAIGKNGTTKITSPTMTLGAASISLTSIGGIIDTGAPFVVKSRMQVTADEIYWPAGSHSYMEGSWYRNYNDYSAGLLPIGEWNTYAPSITGTGFTVGNTGGNILDGQWARIGNTIFYRGRMSFGSNGAAGNGAWSISLPRAMKDAVTLSSVFCSPDGVVLVGGSAQALSNNGSTTVGFYVPQSNTSPRLGRLGGGSTFGTPGGQSWTTGGYMRWFITYETSDSF